MNEQNILKLIGILFRKNLKPVISAYLVFPLKNNLLISSHNLKQGDDTIFS